MASGPSHVRGRSNPKNPSRRAVVGIKGLSGSAKAEDFAEGKLLSGDIVEQVTSSDGLVLSSPFAGGKTGLQKELRRLYVSGQTLLTINVRRVGDKITSIKACIAPDDSSMLKKQYVLKSSDDASHIVMFIDTTEEECLYSQEKRCARMIMQVANTHLAEVNLPYQWDEKMKQVQPMGSSSMVFSMLVVPHAPQGVGMHQYSNLDDTVGRAMAWLSLSQSLGVPISFLSIQTEPLLTKVSGQVASSTVTASSRGELSSIVNTGMYGFEDYHGIDIGIVRAVRLWYMSSFGEVSVALKIEENETRLGVGISRTQEGFCHVSNVESGTAADRAGLHSLLDRARASAKLLVITQVAQEKVAPWLISSDGSIRCYDTDSISRKLSAHRHAGLPACLHVMACDDTMLSTVLGT